MPEVKLGQPQAKEKLALSIEDNRRSETLSAFNRMLLLAHQEAQRRSRLHIVSFT